VRVITESKLGAVLDGLPGVPRVVMSGNFATPWRALSVLDSAVAEYHLFPLNAQPGIPDQDGVVQESAFVGPGMRGSKRLRYFPCRLSLVPNLLGETLSPDVVLLHTSVPVNGVVSLGIEVNILPAAIEAALARGGLVVAQVNPRMPYTQGDAVLPEYDIDWGHDAATQADQIISRVAHPSVRDELRQAGRDLDFRLPPAAAATPPAATAP
jgi:hypothetical protein